MADPRGSLKDSRISLSRRSSPGKPRRGRPVSDEARAGSSMLITCLSPRGQWSADATARRGSRCLVWPADSVAAAGCGESHPREIDWTTVNT